MRKYRTKYRQYSKQEKEEYLLELGWKNGKKLRKGKTIAQVAAFPLAPSRLTLYRWIKQSRMHKRTKKTPGPKPLLSQAEKEILGGKILTRIQKKKPVTAMWIKNWLKETWNLNVSSPYLTKILHSIHIKSHRTLPRTAKEMREPKTKEMINFLKELQADYQALADPSHFVCMDQMIFWNCGAVPRSYSLVGR
jgi:transposase